MILHQLIAENTIVKEPVDVQNGYTLDTVELCMRTLILHDGRDLVGTSEAISPDAMTALMVKWML
jgi:hypothetical protein